MPLFHYYGRDNQGKAVSGELEQSSDRAVALYLSSNNITPIEINLKRSSFLEFGLLKTQKVSREKIILLTRQLYTISRSNLPINTGLDGLVNSLEPGLIKTVVADISTQLKAGLSLSAAMKKHPAIFNQFYTGMVAIGENSGQLKEIFASVGDYLERELVIKKNIATAVRYPIFVLCSIFIALITINFWVVPTFSDLFERLNAQLPLMTQLLLWMSHFVTAYLWLLVLIVMLFYLAFRYYQNTPTGRLRINKWYYSLPLVGHIFYKAAVARYAQSLCVLIRANVTLDKAIGLAAGVIDNVYFKEQILTVKKNIEQGDSLYKAHSQYSIFSPLILQMIYLGEQTASLDELLGEVAQSYEREIDYETKRMSAVIEPVLIVVLAVFVGILALGVFLPMWSLFETNV